MKISKEFLNNETTYGLDKKGVWNDYNHITDHVDDYITNSVLGWIHDYFENKTTREMTFRIDLPTNKIGFYSATDMLYLDIEIDMNYIVIPDWKIDGYENMEALKYKVVYEGNHLYRLVLRKPEEILTSGGWESCPDEECNKPFRIATPYKILTKVNGKTTTWQSKELYDQYFLNIIAEIFNEENETNIEIIRTPNAFCLDRGYDTDNMPENTVFRYFAFDKNVQNIEDVDFEEVEI